MTTPAPVQILGRHVWSELMTTDLKAAEVFYDKVVGWTSEPFAASPMPYTQFKRGGTDEGGDDAACRAKLGRRIRQRSFLANDVERGAQLAPGQQQFDGLRQPDSPGDE